MAGTQILRHVLNGRSEERALKSRCLISKGLRDSVLILYCSQFEKNTYMHKNTLIVIRPLSLTGDNGPVSELTRGGETSSAR